MITVEALSKQFGGLRAVNDCALIVPAGSITGLIGPNGAGKTTLFNMIAGAFPPSSGRILFDGRDITGLKPHLLFDLGILRTFQIPHEFHRLTALENLMVVPPRQSGEQLWTAWFQWGRVAADEARVRAKAEEVLEFLELTHIRDVKAGNLSGGQKKLLELGRTMMTDARLVLLDEPGAGVNRTLLGKLAGIIERLHRERGLTFFLIEHDMDLIERLCDPVICMAQGSVLVEGAFDTVRRDPRVLEAYLGSAAAPEAVADGAEGAA